MAHLWIQSEAGWNAEKLASPFFELGSPGAVPSIEVCGPNGGDEPVYAAGASFARLARVDAAGVGTWALIASPGLGVRLNGRAPAAGLCVLTDRDEIRVGSSARYFFSTESIAVVEPFPGAERAVFCGRCRQQIETNAPAIRCPGCGVWYDQAPGLPCWTYAQKCVFCETDTALDAGFTWTPEE
ncbi:MAG: hypothetical protein ABR928_02185 [Terracidiphilus sp.]|jgi:hypothetical protein